MSDLKNAIEGNLESQVQHAEVLLKKGGEEVLHALTLLQTASLFGSLRASLILCQQARKNGHSDEAEMYLKHAADQYSQGASSDENDLQTLLEELQIKVLGKNSKVENKESNTPSKAGAPATSNPSPKQGREDTHHEQEEGEEDLFEAESIPAQPEKQPEVIQKQPEAPKAIPTTLQVTSPSFIRPAEIKKQEPLQVPPPTIKIQEPLRRESFIKEPPSSPEVRETLDKIAQEMQKPFGAQKPLSDRADDKETPSVSVLENSPQPDRKAPLAAQQSVASQTLVMTHKPVQIASDPLENTRLFAELTSGTVKDNQNYEWFLDVKSLLDQSRFYDTEKVSTSAGMPYRALEVEDPEKKYGNALPFHDIMEKALSNNLGVVFFKRVSGVQKPIFSLTFGDLQSIDLFNEVHSMSFFAPKGTKKAPKNAEMSIHDPTEEDFPLALRPAIKDYINKIFQISDPKVIMLKQAEEKYFAFNVFPDTFPKPDEAKKKYGDILWFMPTRMSLRVFKSTSDVAKAFENAGVPL